MKDYDLKIIDYGGGKALLIDSLDLIQVTSNIEREQLKEKIEAVYRTVDYVLLLSNMTPDRIHPYFRFFFNNRDVILRARIFCYRYTTHKGETMIKMRQKKEHQSLREKLEKLGADEK